MTWLWKSVVGKLWITIIALVTAVLLILSFLLVQFLDQFYFEKESQNLLKAAEKTARLLQEYPNQRDAILTATELAAAFGSRVAVVGVDESLLMEGYDVNQVPRVKVSQLFENSSLNRVLSGEKQVYRGIFLTEEGIKRELLVVGIPLFKGKEVTGGLIMYRTLKELIETTRGTKKLIIYGAIIGIALTTVFAFFLSTRITNPLRQMKKAADRISRGEFSTTVSIRSDDEIGDLASTFNYMAKHLDELIHALSREKEQLSSILRSMADGVITVDQEGQIIVTNPPAEEFLRSWKFQNHDKSAAIDLPEPLLQLLEMVYKEEKEQHTDIQVQGRTWSVVMAPLYDMAQIRGVVAVLRDMTEERRLDKLRKDFVANVSHELRTPLSMLQGYSEAIVDDVAASPEERKEIARIIYDESLRMGRLVNDLLDLARMEAGNTVLELSHVNMVHLIEKVMRKFTALSKEEKVFLIKDIAEPIPLIKADADRLEQVLTNLIDNAIRHTHEGGKVFVRSWADKHYLNLQVEDTGSGIPEDDIPFVFERFYKADKARTRGKSGTGLGLAIVKNIVETHGGTITVHSRLGEGTSFTARFPLQ
ncbi:ATP-binding protein [Microaerobacter geothermalis]|uniref:HAMP domain-containing sensor histidine kinase n=1 Tax=Microaerobacter geothermalis TaxID=674972 RepID=UPI001F2D504A|nr:ATP-binding protein [Microaerobacter geothermalis]MCF6093492.1 ATP-binding protein [Microaerobacter geothermalis]